MKEAHPATAGHEGKKHPAEAQRRRGEGARPNAAVCTSCGVRQERFELCAKCRNNSVSAIGSGIDRFLETVAHRPSVQRESYTFCKHRLAPISRKIKVKRDEIFTLGKL